MITNSSGKGEVAPAMAMQKLKIFYTVDLVIDKGWSGSSPALKSEVQCGPTISSPQNFRPKVREKQCTEVHFSRNRYEAVTGIDDIKVFVR